MPNRRDSGAPGRGPLNVSEPDSGGERMRVPPALRGLHWELPDTCLGLDDSTGAFESARVLPLPVPYEATTRYGGGTRSGPGAIIETSRFIELYDQELDCEPYELGICPLPALEL